MAGVECDFTEKQAETENSSFLPSASFPWVGLFSTFLVPQFARPALFFFYPRAIFVMLHIYITKKGRASNLKKKE